jgi:hypothetical protein
MSQKMSQNRNEYRCAVETNQNGKYAVRIRAAFGRRGWVLSSYFLASSFDRAMKKLEDCLQFLQRHEDRLWFWGVDRSDDPSLAGELLKEIGLQQDRRMDFPRRAATILVAPDRPVPAFSFASMRRTLADTIGVSRAVAVGD